MNNPALIPPIQVEGLLHNSGDPLFVVNSRRRIVFFNRACEALAGVVAERAIGLECRWHGPEESYELAGLAGTLCPPPEAFAGKTSTVQSLLIDAAGKRSWHTIHFFPLPAADGSLAAILGRITPADPDPEPPQAPESLRQAFVRLRQHLWVRYGFDHVVASSPAMRRVLDQVRLASQAQVSVMLRGEKGSGRETLARTIHYQSPNRERAFVGLDCAGLPTGVLQRQLSRDGILAGADPPVGVLYLREPKSLPRDLQSRLCELLENDDPRARPRIMVGTGADLEQARHRGEFLDELYCRISTLVIDVPPLRERGPDLPLLAQQLLEHCNAESEKQIHAVPPAALRLLEAYPWPGNLPELDTVIRQAHAHARTTEIDASDLPGRLRSAIDLAAMPAARGEKPLPLDELLGKAERQLLQLALRQAKGNLSRAAARLNISRARLHRRLQLFGLIERDRGKDDESPVDETDETDSPSEESG